MGYSYGYTAGGRMALSCQQCFHVGGVRKRPCPVGYCPDAALCPVCYARERQDGTWATHHADCPRAHAQYEAEQAAKRAEPTLWARSARGDWAEGVPAGMVEVITWAGTVVLVPKGAYEPGIRGFGAA